MLYMEKGQVEGKSFARAPYLYLAIAIAALGTVGLGLLPATALDLSRLSFLSLHSRHRGRLSPPRNLKNCTKSPTGKHQEFSD